jgi:hypothetical protein
VFKFLRRLFCQHDWSFAGNLYGDQIIEWGGKRSVWTCVKCDKTVARDKLHIEDDKTDPH